MIGTCQLWILKDTFKPESDMYYAECGKTLCMTFPQKKAFKKYKNKTLLQQVKQ